MKIAASEINVIKNVASTMFWERHNNNSKISGIHSEDMNISHYTNIFRENVYHIDFSKPLTLMTSKIFYMHDITNKNILQIL